MFGFSGGQGDCGASNWCMVAHWPHWPHRQGSVVPHLHLQTPAPTHHMAQHTSKHGTQLTSRHGTTEFKRHIDGIKNILVCTEALLHFIIYWLGYLTPPPPPQSTTHLAHGTTQYTNKIFWFAQKLEGTQHRLTWCQRCRL